MSRVKRMLAALFLGIVLHAEPAVAKGNLIIVGKFVSANSEVDVATYSALDDKGVEKRIGLIGIAASGHRISVAFNATDFLGIIALWNRASAIHSDQWQSAGEYVENGTKDVSHLRMSGGPGVRVIIESAARGAFTSEIAASDEVAFDSALEKAGAFIGAPSH